MSVYSDEGLDLSQRISESIFAGPDLDPDGEEVILGQYANEVDLILWSSGSLGSHNYYCALSMCMLLGRYRKSNFVVTVLEIKFKYLVLS